MYENVLISTSSLLAGNSIKDDSLYSSSTQKQSIDSVALSRGHSVKRFNHDRSVDCENFDRPQMFTSKVMMASSAHLNLYTQEQELCLNIYPSNDSLSHQPTENLSRISIQLNRLSSDETHQHSLHRPHICPSVISPASASQPTMPGTAFAATSLDENLNQSNRRRKLPNDVTNLDLICSQQGEIKIFIKRKKRHQDSRLKLWRCLHRMSPLKGKQHHHNRHPTAVHFYSPVLCSQKESVEDDHNSHASSTANMYPIGFNMPVSEGQEDDLEAYMKEIKLRENQSGPIP